MSKDKIQNLKRLTAAWKSQFDNPPSLSFAWDTDISGILRLNGVRICPLYELAAADTFDAGWLRLDLKDGSYVIVEIDWPFEGPARISEIVTHREVLQ